MEDTVGGQPSPDPAMAALARLGWRCEWHNWRSADVSWNDWDAVYVAATYDYPQRPEAFLALLGDIERSAAVLVNPLSLVEWNVDKAYLREIEQRGVAIVPGRWYSRAKDCDLDADGKRFGTDALVVKPAISTNATDTFLMRLPADESDHGRMAAVFADRDFVVQPFVEAIQREGEYSLFYFGGVYSHAIRKIPKASDYRVQEEHGGHVVSHRPSDALLAAADHLLSVLPAEPVYARCDYVQGANGDYQLMEVELIEPSLYLETNDMAAIRFAEAFNNYVNEQGVRV